jgi:hypothetical protein
MTIHDIHLTKQEEAVLWFPNREVAEHYARAIATFYNTDVLLAERKDGSVAICTNRGCVEDPDVTGHDIEIVCGDTTTEVIPSHKRDNDDLVAVVAVIVMILILILG